MLLSVGSNVKDTNRWWVPQSPKICWWHKSDSCYSCRIARITKLSLWIPFSPAAVIRIGSIVLNGSANFCRSVPERLFWKRSPLHSHFNKYQFNKTLNTECHEVKSVLLVNLLKWYAKGCKLLTRRPYIIYTGWFRNLHHCIVVSNTT